MDKMRMESPDMTEQNIDKIAALFPNCITEAMGEDGKLKRAINFDLLRQMLSGDVVEGDEAYEFTWVGKKAAIVEANKPIRKTLRPCVEESRDWDTTENLYIEGDNLEVLKLLQESYLGKVKMIYIDPPYNTGNDFIYRDDFALSSGEYQEQRGMFDEETGDRLFKNTDSNGRFHSDWCSMIYPRLMLARNLLCADGAIFISIDDHEADNLKKICDEVFGGECFVADISWQRTYSTRNDSKGIVSEVEHIIVFSKFPDWSPNKLPRTAEMNAIYKNPDNDIEPWTSDNPFAPGASTHQGMVYAIQHPFTGEMIYPSSNACWRYQQNEMLNIMSGWGKYELKDLHDEEERAKVCGIASSDVRKDVKGIVLVRPLEEARAEAQRVYDRGQWPKFYFTKDGTGGIRRKTYLSTVGGKLPTNFWPYSDVGHTDEAKKELKALFDGSAPFDTPKPVRLLDRILTIATDKDSVVLDFFSGSATTAQAVMEKNQRDEGKRKFILVQVPEKSSSPQYETLCEIGKERIRRAGDKIIAECASGGGHLCA
jgi:adenine-specific DNA-methyltransferase